MRARAALLFITLVSCKDKAGDQHPPSPAPSSPPAVRTIDAGAPPRLDSPPTVPTAPAATTPTQPLGAPLTIEDAAKALPALAGKQILPLRPTSDQRQVHATWCLEGQGADQVARDVGRQLATAGYADIAIRGDAHKAGVQGTRGGFRLSMIVSASSASNCPAPAYYFANATIFREPTP